MDLPWKPSYCHSGYFMMSDVSQCRDLIPPIYFQTHEYEPDYTPESAKNSNHIIKNHLYMPGRPEKTIPLNLAFSRWMAIENRVTMMPNCFFYHRNSPYISENHVRLAICKPLESVKKVCQRLRKIKI